MPERRAGDSLVAGCHEAIRRGSLSFAGAARLFAPDTREAAYLLYAWCRHCDDQIDGERLGLRTADVAEAAHGQRDRLDRLVDMTRRALAGESVPDPAFQALGRVVERHGIPAIYPFELLEGFAMDVDETRYVSLEDLLRYCYHVAGVVGLMMAHVMGVREETALRRAADLGIALQMTNIARDVLDDARAGRLYLPLEWLRETGIEPADVALPAHRERLAGVARRLLDEAERYYASGDEGLKSLPLRSAWAVAVAGGVYREIGRLVRARGAAAWDVRAVVPRRLKLAWLVKGLAQALSARVLGRLVDESPRANLWTRGATSLD
jgi:15-cis-phytoene synthase